MAVDAHSVVKSFSIFKYESVRLIVVVDPEDVQGCFRMPMESGTLLRCLLRKR